MCVCEQLSEVALSVSIILLPSVSDHYMPIFPTLLQLLSGTQLQLLGFGEIA